MEYKGYLIKPITNLIGYEIRHTGKGSLANVLNGSFTSVKIAKIAIDTYLFGKEGDSGKDVQRSRDKQV